jgi:hypothetical protein
MRGLLALALLALLLPGCSDSSEPSADTHAATSMPPAPLPAAIHANETMPLSADPLNSGGPACTPPASTCFRYPFDLQGNASVQADLRWTVIANDLDLYLMQGGDVLAASNGAQTASETLAVDLGAGSYEFVVQGSTSGPEPFRFDASFSEARPAGPNP